jgi:hypothetical protein
MDPDGGFTTLNPLELILLLKTRAEDLDSMDLESPEEGDASKHIHYFLVWLWLANKRFIPPLEMELAIGDAEAMEHKVRCHAILPPLGGRLWIVHGDGRSGQRPLACAPDGSRACKPKRNTKESARVDEETN